MSKLVVTREFHVRTEARGRKRVHARSEAATTASGIPRVAKLMALAIRFDELIREGKVADQAELARVGCVTRARLSQIMNFLNLAPDIQAQLLEGSQVSRDRADAIERMLRPIAATPCWRKQRMSWVS
jgi:hypothetical protein